MTYSDLEIVTRGQQIYDRELRSTLEPAHTGRFVAIDIGSRDYEIDILDVAAITRLRRRHPDAATFVLRIGFPTAYRLGGGFKVGTA